MSDLSKSPLHDQSPPGRDDPVGRSRADDDKTPLNWLLLVPIVICLAVPFYNNNEPTLFGLPFFYWFQLAIIPIGVACTVIVYRAHRRNVRGGR